MYVWDAEKARALPRYPVIKAPTSFGAFFICREIHRSAQPQASGNNAAQDLGRAPLDGKLGRDQRCKGVQLLE